MTEFLLRLFVKRRRETSDPKVRAAYGMLGSIVGIAVNLLLFAAKFTVGLLFGAVSIRADGINNLSDAASQLISLISFRISSKPADREHPFGHARIEYIASMIVSLLILLVGGELLRESIGKMLHPALPTLRPIAAIVLGISILAKLWLFLFHRTLGKRIDSSVMRATATDSLSDALSTTVVLISTLVLLIFPECGINFDAYMGAIVAIIIIIAGIKLWLESKNSILGEAPSQELIQSIERVVSEYPDALGIHDLTLHNYGPGRIIAALHIEVDGKQNIFDLHDTIDLIEQRLRRELEIEATIHMDPIVTDDERVSALHDAVAAEVRAIDERLRIHDFRFVEGKTHTNLIFDMEVPFELKTEDGELRRAVADRISRLDPTYFTVIQIDRV